MNQYFWSHYAILTYHMGFVPPAAKNQYLRWKRPKTKSLCFARASGLTQAARIYKNVLKRGTKALQNRTRPGTQKWSQNDANMDPKTSQNGADPMGYPPPSGSRWRKSEKNKKAHQTIGLLPTASPNLDRNLAPT